MTQDAEALIRTLAADARQASRTLGTVSAAVRADAIRALADAIPGAMDDILAANERDLARGKDLPASMQDRLALDPDRLAGAAAGLRKVADLEDPVGTELARWTVPSGLDIARVRTPLGVIAIIYEARPLVTIDAAALCLKAGNAAILRPGSDSLETSAALGALMRETFAAAGLPAATAQVVPTPDRAAVGAILKGGDGNIDIVVPRGGRSLVERVQEEARIPVIGHLEGVCHVYVDGAADPEMAEAVVVNAKMRRTGICGAAETLLVDQAVAADMVPRLVAALQAKDCEVRGDAQSQAIVPSLTPATEADWTTEYLAPIISLKVVDGVNGAIAHIGTYGSGHTESIITADTDRAERFLAEVDAAIVMHNASTQFADGGEFGMGAEIGIATGRLHARGPVGAAQLTTFKYQVYGSGQTRP